MRTHYDHLHFEKLSTLQWTTWSTFKRSSSSNKPLTHRKMSSGVLLLLDCNVDCTCNCKNLEAPFSQNIYVIYYRIGLSDRRLVNVNDTRWRQKSSCWLTVPSGESETNFIQNIFWEYVNFGGQLVLSAINCIKLSEPSSQIVIFRLLNCSCRTCQLQLVLLVINSRVNVPLVIIVRSIHIWKFLSITEFNRLVVLPLFHQFNLFAVHFDIGNAPVEPSLIGIRKVHWHASGPTWSKMKKCSA